MSLFVCGSIALDTVRTPHGYAERVLGGSAIYFSYAAGFFTQVRLFGPVGEDFPAEHLQLLKERGIDTSGVTELPCKTFSWHGSYQENMNNRLTEDIDLGIFELFTGDVPENLRDTPFVFLANASPELQLKVLSQMKTPRLVVADTMDHWIEREKDRVLELFARVQGVVLNEDEAKMLTGVHNLPLAGQKILEMGPEFVIIKKGEHGSFLAAGDNFFVLPAYPVTQVKDPTGAGDSFAGGFMGSLAREENSDFESLKRAMAYGTVLASINVEDFSLERFKQTTMEQIDKRLNDFKKIMSF